MIIKLEIPTGNPIHIELKENLSLISYRYLDQDRAKEIIVKK